MAAAAGRFMPHVLQVWTKYFQRVTTPLVYSVRHGCDMRGYKSPEIPADLWDRVVMLLFVWADRLAEDYDELVKARARAQPLPPEVERRCRADHFQGGRALLRQVVDAIEHLPEPARRGRPKRPSPAVAARLAEVIDRLAVTGEERTTAAKAVLRSGGAKGKLKGPADHLARLSKREPK